MCRSRCAAVVVLRLAVAPRWRAHADREGIARKDARAKKVSNFMLDWGQIFSDFPALKVGRVLFFCSCLARRWTILAKSANFFVLWLLVDEKSGAVLLTSWRTRRGQRTPSSTKPRARYSTTPTPWRAATGSRPGTPFPAHREHFLLAPSRIIRKLITPTTRFYSSTALQRRPTPSKRPPKRAFSSASKSPGSCSCKHTSVSYLARATVNVEAESVSC